MSPFTMLMEALRERAETNHPPAYKAAEYAAYVTAALYEAIRSDNVAPEELSVFGWRAVEAVRAARSEHYVPWSITDVARSEATQRVLDLMLDQAKRYASRLRFPTEVWCDAVYPYIKILLPEPLNCTVHVRYDVDVDMRLAQAIRSVALLRGIAQKRGISISSAMGVAEVLNLIRAKAPRYADAACAVLGCRPLPVDKEPNGFATLVQRAELQALDMMRAIHGNR